MRDKKILLKKIQEFENCVKNAMENKNVTSMSDLFIYCGSTAMNLLFLSNSIEVFGDNPITLTSLELKSQTRKMHDIDIHVFNEDLYKDLENERDKNGNERIDYPYKIAHDNTWFGKPKKFANDDRNYIVIDRFKETGKEVKPQDYAVVKVEDKKYQIESPLNLLAYKIAFSLQQARLFKYPKAYTVIDEMKLKHNSFDIDALCQFAESLYPKELIKKHILNVLNKLYEKDLDSKDSLAQLKSAYEEVYCEGRNNIPPIQNDIIGHCLTKFFEEKAISKSSGNYNITKDYIKRIAKEEDVVAEKENVISFLGNRSKEINPKEPDIPNFE